MYATRSETWRFEMTAPQTGMYGFFGFADSPSPWLMMWLSWATVSCCPADVSAGTAGETPPPPLSPWHWAQANCTNACAPAATFGSTDVPTAPAALVVALPIVFVLFV